MVGMIKFDNKNLFETAEAVVVMNPYLVGTSKSWLVGDMEAVARQVLHTDGRNVGYVSTRGYVLTFFTCKHDPENVHVKASVEANTAAEYIRNNKKKG